MTPSGLKSHLFVTCDYNYFSDITLVFYTLQWSNIVIMIVVRAVEPHMNFFGEEYPDQFFFLFFDNPRIENLVSWFKFLRHLDL